MIPKEDGSYESIDTGVRWASVSRHGLVQQGITCPLCERLAAPIGDFSRVSDTPYGEAVGCTVCKAVLLASPDDDVDPVNPLNPYDETIYHKFARPTKPAPRPLQRIRSIPPSPGDWIVIITRHPYSPGAGHPPTDLFGTEGRVETVSGDTCVVAVSGNHGIGGAGGGVGSGLGGAWATISLKHVAVMVTPSLRVGDLVRIDSGDGAGLCGGITSIFKGKVEVETDTVPYRTVSTVIERVAKFHLDERTLTEPVP